LAFHKISKEKQSLFDFFAGFIDGGSMFRDSDVRVRLNGKGEGEDMADD
jgi:hypothetical protein